jgi:hypothetical protein
MSAEEAGRERQDDDSARGQNLPGSAGAAEGESIPGAEEGVGIGAGTEANTFEPEEDPDAVGENKET